MATRTRKLEIEIGSEAKGVGKGFDRAAKEGDKLADKLGAAGRKGGRELAGNVEKETDKLGAKLRDFGSKASDTLGSGFELAGSAAADGLSSGFDIGVIADSMSGALGSLPGQLAPVAGATGAAIGGALVVGLEEAMDREISTDRLAARLGATAEESERFGRIAGDLYADAYGESIDEVTLTLDALISSVEGFGTASDGVLTEAGGRALDFANIWGVDVAEAVGDVGILVNTGLARDWEHAFDLMHVAMQQTPAAFRDELIPAVEEYSGFVSTLGFTGEEAFAIMTRSAEDFGTFGIDKSMDALKEFQIRATDMSALSVAAFDTIGLDAQTMANRILAGGDTARGAFDEIIAGLAGIEDPALRANTSIALFGTPIEDLSTEQIPDFLGNLANLEGGLGDVSGAADQAGDTLNDNLGTRLETIKRQILDGLVTFVDTRLIPGFERLSDIFDTRVRPALELIAPPFRAVLDFLREHPGVLQFALALLAVAAGLAILFNPLTVAIGLIGGLILAIQFLWGKLQEGWAWVQEHWPGIAEFLTNPIGAAKDFISDRFDEIKAGATGAKDWIVARFNDVVGFITGLPGTIADAASGMWDGIKDAFRSAINTVIRWWNRLAFPSLTIGGFDPLGRYGPSIPETTIGGWELPDIPELEHGAIVRHTLGGTVARLGEGRFDEAVVPLDGRHGGGDTIIYEIHVHGSLVHESELDDRIVQGVRRAGGKGVPLTVAGRRL